MNDEQHSMPLDKGTSVGDIDYRDGWAQGSTTSNSLKESAANTYSRWYHWLRPQKVAGSRQESGQTEDLGLHQASTRTTEDESVSMNDEQHSMPLDKETSVGVIDYQDGWTQGSTTSNSPKESAANTYSRWYHWLRPQKVAAP